MRWKYAGVGQGELSKDGVWRDGKGVRPIETGILDSLRSRDHPRDATWVQ